MNKKRWFITILTIIGVLAVVFLYENTYDFTEKTRDIPTSNGKLSTFVASPKKNIKTKGVVIFVHGDGAINATQDGGYKPQMEKFAEAGYYSVSWDKPGVGKSTGNWLDQSMTDRAKEVETVIKWVKKNKEIDSTKIILWGASQAGWVIPKVIARKQVPVTSTILVSPAINWLEQGKYNTKAEMKAAGKSNQQINQQLQKNAKRNILIKENAPYKEYQQSTKNDKERLSKDRWQFAKRNYSSDATNDLKKIDIPVHLILAGKDINVDISDTEKVYRRWLPKDLLSVKIINNVPHTMINPLIADHAILINTTALLAPKDFLISRTYLEELSQIGHAD